MRDVAHAHAAGVTRKDKFEIIGVVSAEMRRFAE